MAKSKSPPLHRVIPERLTQVLDEYLEQRKIKQEDFARLVGADPGSVSGWKSGENEPKSEHLLSLSMHLGKSPFWLCGYDGLDGNAGKQPLPPGVTLEGFVAAGGYSLSEEEARLLILMRRHLDEDDRKRLLAFVVGLIARKR